MPQSRRSRLSGTRSLASSSSISSWMVARSGSDGSRILRPVADALAAASTAKSSDDKWLAYTKVFLAMDFDLGAEGNEGDNLRRRVERASKEQEKA